MDRIVLRYTPTTTELLQTTMALRTRRYTRSQRFWLSGVIFAVMLVGGLFAGFGGTYIERTFPVLPPFVATLVLIVLVLVAYVRLIQPWALRRSGAMVDAASPPREFTFDADETGLVWTGATERFELQWAGIEIMFAPPGALAFMTGAIAFVVPTRAFESPEAVRDFVSFALERLRPDRAAASRADPSIARLLG